VSWEAAWAGAAVARRFVQRLSELDETVLRQAVPPVLDRDPYLSAWSNIQAALGNAPAADRARLQVTATSMRSRFHHACTSRPNGRCGGFSCADGC
jgi:hypothetical protein